MAEYAAWAVYAFRKLDDPFGVIRVARAHGMAGHGPEALKVLSEVPKTWPRPRLKDLDGKTHRGGHPRRTFLAVADVYIRMGQFRSAWLMYQASGYGPRRAVNSMVAWTALRAGDRRQAEGMFRVLAERGRTDRAKRDGHSGLAYLALLDRNAPAAREHLEAIRSTGLKATVPGALKWAAVYAGDEGAVGKLDALDLLGVYGLSFGGKYDERGLYVLGLLGDGALTKAFPSIRPRDVILRVGTLRLDRTKAVNALRKTEVTAGPTRLLVRRNKRTFEATVDLQATLSAAEAFGKGKGKETTE